MTPIFPLRRTRRAFPAASEHGEATAPVDPSAPPTWEGRRLARPEEDVEDQGLSFDIGTLVSRRGAMGVIGAGSAAAVLAACSAGGESTDATTGGSASDAGGADATASSSALGEEMPTETAGPYPGDGSNGADVLEISGVERSDITTSIDTGTVAAGAPLTLTMNIIDMVEDDAPMTGAAVYVWHCDAHGEYSMYSEAIAEETYLRGVQVVGEDGTVTFTTIFPACYSGRWPHIHFEVFPDIASITDAGNAILTSQIALPEDVAETVYSDAEYDGSADNLSQVTLESDNVFSDGWDLQLAEVTGDMSTGFALSIDVPIDTSTAQQAAAAPAGGGGDMPPAGAMPSDGGGEPPAGGPGTATSDDGS